MNKNKDAIRDSSDSGEENRFISPLPRISRMDLLSVLKEVHGEAWDQPIRQIFEEVTNFERREVVSWPQVKAFMKMAEEALQAKASAAQEAASQLEVASTRAQEALEEQDFLKTQLETLISERTAQQRQIQELIRHNHSLEAELGILRAHMVAAGQGFSDSPTGANGQAEQSLRVDGITDLELKDTLEEVKSLGKRLSDAGLSGAASPVSQLTCSAMVESRTETCNTEDTQKTPKTATDDRRSTSSNEHA